jgi:CheY-like chemotaxis protein
MLSKHKTLLVVEDDTDIREGLRDFFQIEGYPVMLAENGEDALEILKSLVTKPKLIFLDLQMPQMSGQEFLRQMKEDPQLEGLDIPVVVISASAQNDHRHPLAGFIKKPLEADELLTYAERFCF